MDKKILDKAKKICELIKEIEIFQANIAILKDEENCILTLINYGVLNGGMSDNTDSKTGKRVEHC